MLHRILSIPLLLEMSAPFYSTNSLFPCLIFKYHFFLIFWTHCVNTYQKYSLNFKSKPHQRQSLLKSNVCKWKNRCKTEILCHLRMFTSVKQGNACRKTQDLLSMNSQSCRSTNYSQSIWLKPDWDSKLNSLLVIITVAHKHTPLHSSINQQLVYF